VRFSESTDPDVVWADITDEIGGRHSHAAAADDADAAGPVKWSPKVFEAPEERALCDFRDRLDEVIRDQPPEALFDERICREIGWAIAVTKSKELDVELSDDEAISLEEFEVGIQFRKACLVAEQEFADIEIVNGGAKSLSYTWTSIPGERRPKIREEARRYLEEGRDLPDAHPESWIGRSEELVRRSRSHGIDEFYPLFDPEYYRRGGLREIPSEEDGRAELKRAAQNLFDGAIEIYREYVESYLSGFRDIFDHYFSSSVTVHVDFVPGAAADRRYPEGRDGFSVVYTEGASPPPQEGVNIDFADACTQSRAARLNKARAGLADHPLPEEEIVGNSGNGAIPIEDLFSPPHKPYIFGSERLSDATHLCPLRGKVVQWITEDFRSSRTRISEVLCD
jgi:hypothetical protein